MKKRDYFAHGSVTNRKSAPQTVKKVTLIAIIAFMLVTSVTMGPARLDAAGRRPRKKNAGGKTSSKLQQKRASTEKALARLQQEIAKYESELREHEKKEKHSKENIHAFEKREENLKAAIARIEQEASDLEGQKSEVDQSITATSSLLESRKEAYAKSSLQLYMQGTLAPINPILIATSESDPIRMSYYAQAISRAHAMDKSRLDSLKRSLGISSETLASNIANEEVQIGTKQQAATTLEQKKAAEAIALAQIQNNKARLKKLLDERKASEKRLENIIASLVTKEHTARHITKGRHHATSHEEEFENDATLGPAHGPHSSDWPSASHRVAQGFGEHRNAELGTVTMNLGIDIASPEGSSVRASAEGEVVLVSSLPSYGTVVVIRHSGGIHTVYADLASSSVQAGTHIRAGQTIGKSGTNEMSGAVLHFEVWKGKSKQNPIGWLK
jgi:septal ring factor EnvC (AmiA/AmiB activator)